MLSGYQRQGKRFVPPIFRLPGLVEVNFREEWIPDLLWVSSLFLQLPGNQVIDVVVEFVKTSESRLGRDSTKPLVFSSNFLALTPDQLCILKADSACNELISFLSRFLHHQFCLLDGYPLSSLISPRENESVDDSAVEQLKLDVGGLLDRNSLHASKVQATVLISLVATGRMRFSRHVSVPDLSVIFESPGSAEAKRAAGFVRSSLNAGSTLFVDRDSSDKWCKSFWTQSYALSPCE